MLPPLSTLHPPYPRAASLWTSSHAFEQPPTLPLPQLSLITHGPTNRLNFNGISQKTMEASFPVLTTKHTLQEDIGEVIRHCAVLNEDLLEHKSHASQFMHLTDAENTTPWLEGMIERAHRILQILVGLRKQQMETKQHPLHCSPVQEKPTSPLESQTLRETSPFSESMSLHSIRQRKRGKRTAFQGRCYSCNISETPEWRRGPDGARTLCNACGLHYAKLTRNSRKEPLTRFNVIEQPMGPLEKHPKKRRTAKTELIEQLAFCTQNNESKRKKEH